MHIARGTETGRHCGLDPFWNLLLQGTWMNLWDHSLAVHPGLSSKFTSSEKPSQMALSQGDSQFITLAC